MSKIQTYTLGSPQEGAGETSQVFFLRNNMIAMHGGYARDRMRQLCLIVYILCDMNSLFQQRDELSTTATVDFIYWLS